MMTVLVVDDDPAIVSLLTDFLCDEGYQVQTATGSAALAFAAKWQPDVILLDMHMPAPDGVEVAHQLRADERTKHVPIILMSAVQRLREHAHEAPVDDLIAKPLDLDNLLTCLGTVRAARAEAMRQP